MQARLREHFRKLSFRSHVDCLRHQLPFAIVDETFRYSFNIELPVHFAVWIQKNRS
jgi:hypothetical protein